MRRETANAPGGKNVSGRFGEHIGEPFIDDAKSGGLPCLQVHIGGLGLKALPFNGNLARPVALCVAALIAMTAIFIAFAL